jgi:predicted aspartyl protease
MASGAVKNLVPVVPVAVLDGSGAPQQFQAILDTGFAGAISLPRSSIERLGLAYSRQEPVTFANGETQESSIYQATAIWEGERYLVPVYQLGPEPLIGMGLLNGNRVTMDVYEDGPISIESL